MGRDLVLRRVAELIAAAEAASTVRVAIDGIDAAGKTTLADELAPLIIARGRPVIRAGIDGFHNPRSVRYERGRLSPEGYFQDSYNLPAIVSQLLAPLGPGGSSRYQAAIFDWQTDRPVEVSPEVAPPKAILLFDGIFLARPELAPYWDLFIFVQISFETCLARAVQRYHGPLNVEEVVDHYQARYLPAQRSYLNTYHPADRAGILLDNNDFGELRILRDK